MPNVVTPNGDGLNDAFYLKHLSQDQPIKVSLVNRWGRLIFKEEDYQDTWNGAQEPGGAYFYEITFTGSEQRIRGSVQLIR